MPKRRKPNQYGVISEITKKQKADGSYEALWHELNLTPHYFDLDEVGEVVWDIADDSSTQGWKFDKDRPFELVSGDLQNIGAVTPALGGRRLKIENLHVTPGDVVVFNLYLENKKKTASTDPSFFNRGIKYTSRPKKIRELAKKAKGKKKAAKKTTKKKARKK